MPNWVATNYNVTLPTRNVKRFLNYFLTCDNVDQLRGRYLYRTFIEQESIHVVETQPGVSHITFFANSAWSLESILVEHDPSEGGKCVDLEWVCKDCGVISLSATGDEPGCGFRQFIEYDEDNGIALSDEDITPWCCEECHTFGYWEDYPEDIDRTICPECGEKLYNDEEDN